ncbi:phosphotransferase family protein [Amycolatopsis orientalis]|uniref:phosphotransferase family protein n=1 Tax=Amycolatopsis orientalis TaxID=31958 RepID=UPI00056B2AA1|nr:phosphotransferase [Amycolatopsis orientalis]
MTDPRRVATAVLSEHGVDISTAERGRGWTNATWLAEDCVVRVASRPGPADLLREARLVELLPAETGCPPVLAAGVLDGHQWVLSRRIPGRNLEEVWPDLDDTARASAVDQMWDRVRFVHRTAVETVRPFLRSRSPFFSTTPAEASALLGRLTAAGELTRSEADGLDRVMTRFWRALPAAPRVVNHGDFCVPNTLWHDGRVTALLDFEFAFAAPAAADLNELVKIGYAPGPPAERVPLRPVVDRIARETLAAGGGPDVLLGYSIMLEAWTLERESSAPDPDEADLANARAMLAAFARGDGGCFAPLLDNLG